MLEDDVFIIDMQLYPVVGRDLLRKRLGMLPLHFLEVPRSIHDLIKTNSVISEKPADIQLRTERRSIDPHFKPFSLKRIDQVDGAFSEPLRKYPVQRKPRGVIDTPQKKNFFFALRERYRNGAGDVTAAAET